MTPYKELTSWILQNQERFTSERYSLEDIVNLAIACGFDRNAIAQWQTRQIFGEAV